MEKIFSFDFYFWVFTKSGLPYPFLFPERVHVYLLLFHAKCLSMFVYFASRILLIIIPFNFTHAPKYIFSYHFLLRTPSLTLCHFNYNIFVRYICTIICYIDKLHIMLNPHIKFFMQRFQVTSKGSFCVKVEKDTYMQHSTQNFDVNI